MKFLLDTHVLVRWVDSPWRLSAPHARVLRRANEERPAIVSDISLWEITMLCEAGRLRPRIASLRQWLEEVARRAALSLTAITPSIAAAVAELPPTFHRDPADRILVATARTLGATLLTEDERILEARLCATL
jgi:PIN domain nuclease of toxin-antitoxin system